MLNKLKEFKFDKHKFLKDLYRLFLVVLGTLILSFGSGVFLVPFQIVSGGITGIGILLSDFIAVDITAYIFTRGFFLLGLIFLGIRFSLTTLVSTIIYPVMLSVLLRTGFAEYIANLLLDADGAVTLVDGVISDTSILSGQYGLLLVCGIIGGACVGLGCSLTFLGGGSTGGVDILSFIINKFTGIKTSLIFLCVDGTIILSGIIVNLVSGNGTQLGASLIGIVAAVISSLMIEIVYVSKEGAYMVDIISDKHEDFVQYSLNELDRGATIYEGVGAYSEEKKIIVRIVFNRRELIKVKDAIARIDPKAFVTFTKTMLVGGEGFSKIKDSHGNLIKTLQKSTKNKEKQKETTTENDGENV